SLKTSIKTITYLSDIGCLEIQGASLHSPYLSVRSAPGSSLPYLATCNQVSAFSVGWSFNRHS
ncbi:hypothetical protein, partial [Escherichia coli]|uniref:hypothetical protein n=1 Tax=Escherichia coli TaxID=562 RepID=UPI0019D48122